MQSFLSVFCRTVSLVLVALTVQASAALAGPMASTRYDPAIPSLAEIAGHEPGERLTTPAQIIDYLEALQKAAPDRIRVHTYAHSWQGRPLVYAVIAAPQAFARLDDIQANLARIGSGAPLTETELRRLLDDTPAVAWIGAGVHGDEISPPESVLQLAYHLMAATDDPLADRILAETVIIIDPLQNPDGRARFIHDFTSALGLRPVADRYSAEHDQTWPGGRFNHYIFDMNRDWFAATQPETQGRIRAVLEWHPAIFIDAHEMGGDETYFFPPAADPFNPLITDAQKRTHDLFGRNRAEWFDRFGIAYFTREVFDAFYPGYGDMWPTLNGAIAKTFEQGSARGLIFQRRNGEELTFREGIFNNFIAIMASLETLAGNRRDLLKAYADYRREAVEEGRRSDERYYVFDLSVRRWHAENLARRLAAQGIAVSRLPAGTRACGRIYSAGALVIDKAQPNGRLIRALLEENTDLPGDFIAAQEDRRQRGLPHELYDVTAWSMPVMDGVSMQTCARIALADSTGVDARSPIPAIHAPGGRFGYAVPWSDAGQARLVLAALSAGLNAKATDLPFTIAGRSFPMGSVIFPSSGNPGDMESTLERLAIEIGAEIVPLADSWVEKGPNFGSAAFRSLKVPRIALVWDEGTVPTSAGAARFVLERHLGIAVAPIRSRTISSADLLKYDVLIIPEINGRFMSALSGAETAIADFARKGGVVIGFGSAMEFLSSGEDRLLSTIRETSADNAAKDEEEHEDTAPGLLISDAAAYRSLIADPDAAPEEVPGVLVRIVAETDHWLASGYEAAAALYAGDTIYRPLNEAEGTNVFRFSEPEDLLISGYLWEENRMQLAYKPYVMVQSQGKGLVIGFTQTPVMRAYLGDLELLITNAVLLGPARLNN